MSFFLPPLAMANKILKPYLRRFVLQTHPDFFHHDKLRKTTNAASLQSLYDVLQPSTTTSKQPTSTVKLEFFIKGQKKKDKNTVSSLFCSQDSDWDKADAFLKLCQQANIAVLPTDLETVQDMVKKQSLKHEPAPKYKSLTREFAEKLHKEQTSALSKQDWTEKDIVNQSLIMFDPSVNKKLAAAKLSRWLPQLQPQLWWGKIPMLVLASTSDQPPKELTKGLLVIRDGMELQGRYMEHSPTMAIFINPFTRCTALSRGQFRRGHERIILAAINRPLSSSSPKLWPAAESSRHRTHPRLLCSRLLQTRHWR